MAASALERGEVITTIDNVKYIYVGPAQKSEIDTVTTMLTGHITVAQHNIEHAALAVLTLNGDYGDYRLGGEKEKLSFRVRNNIERDGTKYTVAHVTTTANGVMIPRPVHLDDINKITFDQGTGYDQKEGTSVAWMRMSGTHDELAWPVDTLCLPDDMVSFDGRCWHNDAKGCHGIKYLKLGRFFQGSLGDIIHDGMRLQEIDVTASPWCTITKEADGSIKDGPERFVFLSRSGKSSHYSFAQDVKIIDTMACANGLNLRTVTFPKELRQINKRAFYNCGLREVVLPQTSQIIRQGSSGYYEWTMKWVEEEAFACNNDLETIVIPSFVHLYKDVFKGCPNLKAVYLSGGSSYEVYKRTEHDGEVRVSPEEATLFDEEVYEHCVLYVPDEDWVDFFKTQKPSPFGKFKHIEVGRYRPDGDVDGNGTVNGSDVTALYNVLLKGSQPAGDSDIDGNGVVNGADVTALYNLLLR